MVGKKRKRSKVYGFVDELDDDAIRCRRCKKFWERKPGGDGNTSNIAKHLLSKHKIEVPGINVKAYGKRRRLAEESEGNGIAPANGRPIPTTSAAQSTLPVNSLPTPVEEEAEPDPKHPDEDLDSSTSLSSTPQKLDKTRDRKELAQVVDADTTEVIDEDGIGTGDAKVVEKFSTPHRETVVKRAPIPTVVDMYNVEMGSEVVGVPVGISAPKASDQKVGEELSLFDKREVVSEKFMLSGKVESCSDVSPAEACSAGNGKELSSPGDQHPSSADNADLSLVGAEATDEVEDNQLPEAVDDPAFCYAPSASRDNCEEVENESPPPVLNSLDTDPGTTLVEASDTAPEMAQFSLPSFSGPSILNLVSFWASGDLLPPVERPNQPLLERTVNRGWKFGKPSPQPIFVQVCAPTQPSRPTEPVEYFLNGESVRDIWDETLEPGPVKKRKMSELSNGGERQLPANPPITAVDRPPGTSLSQGLESLHVVELTHSADTPCLPAGEPPDTGHDLLSEEQGSVQCVDQLAEWDPDFPNWNPDFPEWDPEEVDLLLNGSVD